MSKLKDKLNKLKELGLKVYGLFGVFYPVLVFYLKGKGVDLPELGDFTTAVQVTGGVALAQAKPVVKKSDH